MEEQLFTINEEQHEIIKSHRTLLLKLEEIDKKRDADINAVLDELSDLQNKCKHELKFQKRHSQQYDSWTECELCGKEI